MSKRVVVFGGTGAIGGGIARVLAARGWYAGGTSRKIGAATWLVDPNSAADVNEFANNMAENNDVPWGVVWAAGVTHSALCWKEDELAVARTMNTNFFGFANVVRAFAPHMRIRRSGRIIAISSVVASIGAPGAAAYAASKGAIEAYVRSIARELAPRGVTVNCVAPGYIEAGGAGMLSAVPAAQQEQLRQQVPLGRFGEPNDVADAVHWLLNAEAGYVTGQTIQVSGGLAL